MTEIKMYFVISSVTSLFLFFFFLHYHKEMNDFLGLSRLAFKIHILPSCGKGDYPRLEEEKREKKKRDAS